MPAPDLASGTLQPVRWPQRLGGTPAVRQESDPPSGLMTTTRDGHYADEEAEVLTNAPNETTTTRSGRYADKRFKNIIWRS